MHTNRFAFTIALIFSLMVGAWSAAAQNLPDPAGPVVLTVDGAVSRTNADGVAAFDLDMLRAIGAADITTETIWTPGSHVFTGVPLVRLLDHLGATGTTIEAMAINDYLVQIPVSDAIEGGPILAWAMDGETMSRRDKGPLWVIYPFSSSSDYRTEVIYSRSIWQLDRMTIK